MKNIIISIAIIFSFSFSFASESLKLQKAPIDLDDKISLQKGARNFINYCLNCHSASYMRYNRLIDIGLTDDLIKNNLLFTSDKVGDPMSISMMNIDAKKWFGATPPNLSVTARSRGADWIYSYLRGFYRDSSRSMGWNNTIYKNSAMPHILWELQGEQHFDEKTNELKLSLKKMSNDNDKLRKRVDVMIVKYMKTIEELKKDNKKLNDKFDIAYEMHSIPKKKKLDKLLSK